MLFVWSVVWLVGYLDGWLVRWFAGSLVDWLVGHVIYQDVAMVLYNLAYNSNSITQIS